MSLRPTAIAIGTLGMYVVIDDPDTDGPLLIPCSWDHRRTDVSREELARDYELHPAASPPSQDNTPASDIPTEAGRGERL